GIDNLVGYYDELSRLNHPPLAAGSKRLDFYFDVFLQSIKNVKINEYIKEIERYNECMEKDGVAGERAFFAEVTTKHPEFEALHEKHRKEKSKHKLDLIQFLMENSDFLNKEENRWMKSVMQVVRKTSLFFQPQIRTKIMNEGWASFWHGKLFLEDDRIKGHEVDFARVNAGVTALPRVGLNPYALGMHLFYYIKEMADKGKYSFEFERLLGADERDRFDAGTGTGMDFIYKVRENFCDFMFINTFIDQDFVTRNKLLVAERRLNQDKMVYEFFIKSRNAKDYCQMVLDTLYHPPHIEIDPEKSTNNTLYLTHHFEGKPLVTEFIQNTMLGIEYLWGGPVQLETSEFVTVASSRSQLPFALQLRMPPEDEKAPEKKWRRIVYTLENRKLTKKSI
ncbi:MAG: SpoVR family protein, partial [Deltaproteobacteria bacterium]|nr:SpoVR family protein [Deltaproteobacteria bacterium]